ncbi:MAG: hypothetical protein IJK02_10575 [Clostridia bacterium]|nr:hypothetical protein [Clostridia bacterium]
MKLKEDLRAFSGNNKKKALETALTNPCFHAVALFRLSNLLYRMHLSPLAKMVWYYNRVIYSCDIDYRADLAGGFVLVHGIGTVIGRYVRSEGLLRVYQGVTIGGSNRLKGEYAERTFRQPVLKDNVCVYTGAKIFGPVVIGKNNIVKSGAIVTEDKPDKE